VSLLNRSADARWLAIPGSLRGVLCDLVERWGLSSLSVRGLEPASLGADVFSGQRVAGVGRAGCGLQGLAGRRDWILATTASTISSKRPMAPTMKLMLATL
jgi:hypothetical protein